ncbi:MAG: hypothetical protein QOG68_1644 [Solirubrobacteraceae bacterium]|nr:hypothetical protein [Solirubrobacteraceae bacterium]
MLVPRCSSQQVSLRLRVVLPCVLAVLVVAAPPATAAFPGKNGKLAYIARVGAGEQSLITRTGANVRGLLKGGVLASPAWSPLGRRLAFTRDSSDGKEVWIVAAGGQGVRQLTEAGANAADPTWSHAGDQLAYAAGPKGGRHIFVIGADSLDAHQLTSAPADEHDPAWSVRGQIAYAVRNPDGDDIYVVSAAGGAPRRLTQRSGDDTAPSWSPEGNRIAYTRAGDGIWVMGANGHGARRVIKLPGVQSAPAWSPDGKRIAFSSGPRGKRRIFAVNPNGRGLKSLSSATSDGRWPDWQPAGVDPVIEAAGDIACDPGSPYFNGGIGIPRHCGETRTSNLLMDSDLWGVLPLGDEQYTNGELDKFSASYDPTWGRTKWMQHPVAGNHEYQSGATGYFDYFDGVGANTGPAGDRGFGYYSYDIGTWHLIALNSNCTKVPGGCDPGSPQDRWLEADLAAHPAKCTLAYWHSPLFSSQNGGDAAVLGFWQTLAAADADVVLVGHHHYYERFAPQTPGGDRDEATGIREFIVGTGGMSIDQPTMVDPNSQVINATTFGVLRLGLHPDSYDWHFFSASADPFTDVGSARCH